MSASREKKKRQEQYQAGTPKGKAQPEEKKTPVWRKVLYWAIGIVFVLAFIAVMLFNSSFFARNTTAVRVGDHRVSPAMMDVYYSSGYMDFVNQYGDYISYFLDTSKSLSEQYYDEESGETWSDYFMNSAKESLTWAYTMYDKAVAEGYSLSDDEKAYIDANVDAYKDAATNYGYGSVNGYLSAYFGNGVNEKTYRDFLKTQLIANDYYQDLLESFSFTDEDKEAYYAENADKYDTVTLEYSYIRGTADAHTETDENGEEVTVDPTEEENAAAMEAARAQAADLLDGGREAMEAYDLRAINDNSKASISYLLPEDAGDWAYDTSRQEGDMKIFETNAAVYVVRFISRNNNDYLTKNLRLIELVPEKVEDVLDADGNKDTEATDNAQKVANELVKAKAESIFEDWQDGEATEDSFIALVHEYDGDAENDGLYENVSKGKISTEVSDWLYAAERKAGDCSYFNETDNCYIAYYLGEGDNCQHTLVESDILAKAYDDWFAQASAGNTAEENEFGMRFVTTR